jgi:large subunit ribosomal protein L25
LQSFFKNELKGFKMKVLPIKAVKRERSGKTAARSIRKEGMVPGILYGGKETVLFAVEPLEIRKAIYTPDFQLIELDIAGEKHQCILRETQFHPVTDDVMHIDCLQLVSGKRVKLDIPVHCVGDAPGLKAGGTLVQTLRKIQIKTVPEALVSELIVDISGVNLGQSVRVKDVPIPENMEILNPAGTPIANIEVPRALRSAEAEEEEGEEGEEGEVAVETTEDEV